MNTYHDKSQENKKEAVAHHVSQQKSNGTGAGFEDNRNQVVAQRKLQVGANDYVQQQTQPVQKKGNGSGLPAQLKNGIENLSGVALDDVKVHFNSARPAQLQAHAYAQGTEIHLAAGQEKHLPHEAWHVVQQKQGRVKPTVQLHGANINDNQGLEHEADVMGAKALATSKPKDSNPLQLVKNSSVAFPSAPFDIVQRNLKTKTSAHGDKVDGSIAAVRTEVTKVINDNSRQEVLSDIGKLQTSITSRKAEQATFKPTDANYQGHAVRITHEEAQLTRLEAKRAEQLASKPQKQPAQVDADGFTMV